VGSLGCGGVRARRETAEPSRFLGDYSRLKNIEGYDFLQLYIAPGVNWAPSHRLMTGSPSDRLEALIEGGLLSAKLLPDRAERSSIMVMNTTVSLLRAS
jgi:hypothetical protein